MPFAIPGSHHLDDFDRVLSDDVRYQNVPVMAFDDQFTETLRHQVNMTDDLSQVTAGRVRLPLTLDPGRDRH